LVLLKQWPETDALETHLTPVGKKEQTIPLRTVVPATNKRPPLIDTIIHKIVSNDDVA
jgi:hypothetical protein